MGTIVHVPGNHLKVALPDAYELPTLEWVAWFNHHRLLAPIGYMPAAEAEANYKQQPARQAMPT